MTSAPKIGESERATGVSLAAILLVLAGFGAVVTLHFLRTDLDPVRQVMSEYANGSFGVLMTVAFYALGLSALALGLRIRRAIVRTGVARPIPWMLGVAGLGLILAGVFEVERPLVPDTIEEIIHSQAAIIAFVVLILAMLLFCLVCRTDRRWHDFRWIGLALSVIAAAAAAASPLADKSPLTGIAQRTLGAAIFAWLFLVALHIRIGGFRRRPDATVADPPPTHVDPGPH